MTTPPRPTDARDPLREAARALVDSDPSFEEHGVLRVDADLFDALRSALAESPSPLARCAGRCHCHAGADGMMHPPCCDDCAAASPSREAPAPTHWGPRFDAEARCLRHKEHACPSCLAYALGDANAEIARLASREAPGATPVSTYDGRTFLSTSAGASPSSPTPDLAEIERLVSEYGAAIVYGGNGLKALAARAALRAAVARLSRPGAPAPDSGVDRAWVEAVMREIEGEKVTISDFTGNPVVDVIRSLKAARPSSPESDPVACLACGFVHERALPACPKCGDTLCKRAASPPPPIPEAKPCE
jgi:hypothetical protein